MKPMLITKAHDKVSPYVDRNCQVNGCMAWKNVPKFENVERVIERPFYGISIITVSGPVEPYSGWCSLLGSPE